MTKQRSCTSPFQGLPDFLNDYRCKYDASGQGTLLYGIATPNMSPIIPLWYITTQLAVLQGLLPGTWLLMALLILHQIQVQAARGAVCKRTTIVHCSLAIGHGRNRWPLQKSSAWALGGLSVFKLFCHRIGSAALSQCPRIGYLKIRTLSRDNLGQVKLSLGYVRIKNLSHRPWMCATP